MTNTLLNRSTHYEKVKNNACADADTQSTLPSIFYHKNLSTLLQEAICC